MKKVNAIVLMGVVLLSGCAHTMMRGTVAMKVSDTQAHVCLGNDQVKEGDKVKFLVNQCTSTGASRTGIDRCKLIQLGEGTVTQLLNEHYSVVTAAPGVKLEEGTLVEKF